MSNTAWSRRDFLQTAVAGVATASLSGVALGQAKKKKAAAGAPETPSDSYKQIRVAFVGVGGRGLANLGEATKAGCTVAAVVDVDSDIMGKAKDAHPGAQGFTDWRKMLDAMGKEIDAVLVATPDHNHAQVGMAAMQLGKHLYCEKPMTYDIWEARQMAQASRRYKVCTQMGNQHHSEEGLRSQVDGIRAGVLGNVHEVHVWTDRPIWPQGVNRPKDTPPVPETLDWDTWIGPAPMRPYNPAYMPFKWRGWWDFGTGALGDMGCHLVDPPYWALGLDAPISVEASSEGMTEESGPINSAITYHFAAKGTRPAVKLTWYDGGRLPPREATDDTPLPDKKNGVLYVGDKGTMFAATGGALQQIGPKGKGLPTTAPSRMLPASPGHHAEWFEAILANDHTKALSNFDYSGPLTETVLLGNLAVRLQKKVIWDSDKMEVTNAPEAKHLVRRPRRKGWTL